MKNAGNSIINGHIMVKFYTGIAHDKTIYTLDKISNSALLSYIMTSYY